MEFSAGTEAELMNTSCLTHEKIWQVCKNTVQRHADASACIHVGVCVWTGIHARVYSHTHSRLSTQVYTCM